MVIILILCLLLSPFAGTTGQDAPDSDRIKTLGSLKKLDDFPLYTMSFYGDYEIPEYAAGGTLSRNRQIGNQPDNSALWACTCFSAQGEQGNQLLGRNFDWEDHPALLLFTDPPDRYASVSMVDISYLGYSKSDNPEKNPGGLFESPLIPFDGMNEQGLAIGMMALPAADAPQDPQKRTAGSLLIIRLMLDYAKNVEEAVAVIENFNIDPFSSSNALSLLKDVSQPNTIWSVVYDTASLNFLVVMGKKFDRVHEFNLKQAIWDR
jgi:hypothetical protein